MKTTAFCGRKQERERKVGFWRFRVGCVGTNQVAFNQIMCQCEEKERVNISRSYKGGHHDESGMPLRRKRRGVILEA